MATLQTLPDATLVPAGITRVPRSLAPRKVLYAVFKHQRLVIGVFCLVFLAFAVVGLTRPRSWRANTKVMVKLGETVQLAPAEAPSRSVNVPLNTEVVNTEAEIVRSRDVIAEAVKRVGVKLEDGVSMDELVENLRLALTVQPTPASNVLTISYVGKEPKRAADMVNTITDVYLERHAAVYRNEGVHSFYTGQIALLEKEMKAAQAKLQAYLAEHGIIDIDQEINLLNQDVQEQEKGYKAHLAKLAGTEKKLAEVQAQLDRTPLQVPFEEEWLANPTSQTFKDKLAALEIERYQALQRYMPTDRHVRDKDEEIANIKRRIAEEKVRILGKQTIQRNELHRELERNQKTMQVLLADLRERQEPLRKRLEATKERLKELGEKRFTVYNLKQIADERAYAFDLYFKKGEEARITEAMKNHNMVNVSVVERATAPLEPLNGPLAPLVVGLVAGIALAGATAVGIEFLNRTLRFEEEVERHLELPVLAVIPDLKSLPDVAA